MFIKDGKRINIYAPIEDAGIRYHNTVDPEIRIKLGITEIPEPIPPADYSDDTYYKTEQDTEPYIIYTKKSDEQIAETKKVKIQAEIEAEERANLLPRAVREFMLIFLESQFTAEQLALNPGYVKVKAFDEKIKVLRSKK